MHSLQGGYRLVGTAWWLLSASVRCSSGIECCLLQLQELPVTAAEHNKVKQALKEAQQVIANFQQERAAADKGTMSSAHDSEPASGSKGKQAQKVSSSTVASLLTNTSVRY